jgi:hypothetical protein
VTIAWSYLSIVTDEPYFVLATQSSYPAIAEVTAIVANGDRRGERQIGIGDRQKTTGDRHDDRSYDRQKEVDVRNDDRCNASSLRRGRAAN